MPRTITLDNLLPEVFAEEPERHAGSDIWLRPSLTFNKGERYLINAASGRGKSSLCSYLYALRTDYQGRLLIDGEDIRHLPFRRVTRLRRESLALLPQEMRLFPTLDALDNIRLKNRLTGFKSEAEIMEMMEQLDIADIAGRPAARLSLGQQQRVAIVRCLCQPADFIILDEPVSHLDAEANRKVAHLIDREASRQGAGVIVTSIGNHLRLPDCRILNL